MIMLAALLVGLVTIPLLGGRLGRIAELELRSTWLLLVALGLQLAITTVWTVPPDPAAVLHLASYLAAGVWLARNIRVPGMPLVAGGGAANAAAIAANDGVMPAHPDALATAGIVHDPALFENSAAVADADLWFLGDVFAVPATWPLANVFSVGDVVLVLGALWLLHHAAGSRLRRGSPDTPVAQPA